LSVDVLSARKTGKNSSGCREQHFIGTEEASMATSTSANDLLPVYVNAVNVPTMENVQDSLLHVVLGFYIRWMTKKQLKVTNQVKKGIYISYEAHIHFLQGIYIHLLRDAYTPSGRCIYAFYKAYIHLLRDAYTPSGRCIYASYKAYIYTFWEVHIRFV
jgi:hypothetical protein